MLDINFSIPQSQKMKISISPPSLPWNMKLTISHNSSNSMKNWELQYGSGSSIFCQCEYGSRDRQPKIVKFYNWNKSYPYLLDQRLHCISMKQPALKRKHPALFFCCVGHFAHLDPDPDGQNQSQSMRIQINNSAKDCSQNLFHSCTRYSVSHCHPTRQIHTKYFRVSQRFSLHVVWYDTSYHVAKNIQLHVFSTRK